MGGGALMTPILVLLFGVDPLTAVSSDIVASMVMKPIGGAVHWQRGTVQEPLVRWLMLGSIPSAFLGVLLLRKFGIGPGAAESGDKWRSASRCSSSSPGLIVKPLLGARSGSPATRRIPFVVKQLPTLLIGIIGGLIVGVTSVGSGSLIIIMLLMLYPRLRLSELVGTDLVQAVPLVTSAAHRSPAVRQLQAGPHVGDPDRQRPGRVPRRAVLVARARLPDPARADRGPHLSGMKLVGVSNSILAGWSRSPSRAASATPCAPPSARKEGCWR